VRYVENDIGVTVKLTLDAVGKKHVGIACEIDLNGFSAPYKLYELVLARYSSSRAGNLAHFLLISFQNQGSNTLRRACNFHTRPTLICLVVGRYYSAS
jgi:hypothetical protein